MIDPLTLSDEQLDEAWRAARLAAERAIQASRSATPDTWSELARASNRRVAEFQAIDAERHARETIRAAAPFDPIESEGLEPGVDPLPNVLVWLVILMLVAGCLVLWGKTA